MFPKQSQSINTQTYENKIIIYSLILIFTFFSCQENEFEETDIKINNETTSLTINQASEYAKKFFKRRLSIRSSDSNEIIESRSVNKEDNSQSHYIFNFENGYVIINADKKFYPILSYSDEGSFNLEEAINSTGYTYWMSTIDSCRMAIKENWNANDSLFFNELWENINEINSIELRCLTYRETINPIITTNWGQGYPFNSQCPVESSLNGNDHYKGRTPASCVAIAMAQIMNFHSYPYNSTFNWSQIRAGNPYYIGLAIREIGRGVNMSYGKDGSHPSIWPFDDNTVDYLKKCGYKSRKHGFNTNLAISELRNNRPVIVSGYKKGFADILPNWTKGHTWVCDGFDKLISDMSCLPYEVLYETGLSQNPILVTNYLHFNWGWNGSKNGWYINGLQVYDGERNPYESSMKIITVSR